MAKLLFSPRLPDVYKDIEYLLEGDPAEPLDRATKAALPPLIALLEERDARLENALLGNLTILSVDGSLGSATLPAGRDIGWTANFGEVDIATSDPVTGNWTATYSKPFATDTLVVVFTQTIKTQSYLVSVDRFSFTANNGGGGSGGLAPVQGGFIAVGY